MELSQVPTLQWLIRKSGFWEVTWWTGDVTFTIPGPPATAESPGRSGSGKRQTWNWFGWVGVVESMGHVADWILCPSSFLCSVCNLWAGHFFKLRRNSQLAYFYDILCFVPEVRLVSQFTPLVLQSTPPGTKSPLGLTYPSSCRSILETINFFSLQWYFSFPNPRIVCKLIDPIHIQANWTHGLSSNTYQSQPDLSISVNH